MSHSSTSRNWGVGDRAEVLKPASVNSPLRLSSPHHEWVHPVVRLNMTVQTPGRCFGIIDDDMAYIGVSSLIALYPYDGLTSGPTGRTKFQDRTQISGGSGGGIVHYIRGSFTTRR